MQRKIPSNPQSPKVQSATTIWYDLRCSRDDELYEKSSYKNDDEEDREREQRNGGHEMRPKKAPKSCLQSLEVFKKTFKILLGRSWKEKMKTKKSTKPVQVSIVQERDQEKQVWNTWKAQNFKMTQEKTLPPVVRKVPTDHSTGLLGILPTATPYHQPYVWVVPR